MTKIYNYYLADVFTHEPFTGNPLAIFPDADGLSDQQMQAIARELNLSETTFVLPPRTAEGCRVRIFAPAMEIPFAGHPTIGTAFVLGQLKRFELTDGDNYVCLDENIGPVKVRLHCMQDTVKFAQLSVAKLPESGPRVSAEVHAAILGLDADRVCDGFYEPDAINCGVPFHLVPLISVEDLRTIHFDMVTWKMWLQKSWASAIYVFAPSPDAPRRWHARMFSPAFGFFEDPATGAGAATLAAYLAAREPQKNGSFEWEVIQGVEMGRPSRISIEADKQDGKITAVRVAGEVVIIGEGKIQLNRS